MEKPDKLVEYDAIDAKLGIKSSLKFPKKTIALAILIWMCSDNSAEVVYSQEYNGKIIIETNLYAKLFSLLKSIKPIEDENKFKNCINKNLLFTSQIESLMVALELIWKLAKVSFENSLYPSNKERTGGTRYAKKLNYTIHIDIINCLIQSNYNNYIKVLMSWIGEDYKLESNQEKNLETNLLYLLVSLSENSIYKIFDNTYKGIIFNQNGLYLKVIKEQEVSLKDDKEAIGPLRILKASLSNEMNPYLKYSNEIISADETKITNLKAYQKRVDTYLRLSTIKDLKHQNANNSEITEENRNKGGKNIILYGVPGCGKSYILKTEYATDEEHSERVVFYQDYTYTDFIGQILPTVKKIDDGTSEVTYEFSPGPFTSIMKKAYNDPNNNYTFVIEEINRGNAPSIFGDIFQLLDRSNSYSNNNGFPIGTSEYGITNKDMAQTIYNDSSKKVRIPSNLSIVATMNTSDQNVFSLDNAFQRRWIMRHVENSFDSVKPSLKEKVILDTGVTWEKFCTTINSIIISGDNKVSMATAEDKRLGVYFVNENDLNFDENDIHEKDELSNLVKKEYSLAFTVDEKKRLCEIRQARQQNRLFPEKVIKYLWDDAFKYNTEVIFDISRNSSLDAVIKDFLTTFKKDRFNIFNEKTREALGLID